MARSWPKCFLAALVIAFCSVSTRTERSMPLSFATWSRTMFRLTTGACGAGDAIAFLLIKLRFDVCLTYMCVRNAEFPAVHVDDDVSVGKAFQRADEVL